jgi:hypothetical protein
MHKHSHVRKYNVVFIFFAEQKVLPELVLISMGSRGAREMSKLGVTRPFSRSMSESFSSCQARERTSSVYASVAMSISMLIQQMGNETQSD